MKNRVLAFVLCGVLLLFCGCNTKPKQYKRISFESKTLDNEFDYIYDDTVVLNNAKESFSSQVPIYEIKERSISDKEYQQMINNLGLEDKRYVDFELNGNYLNINLASRVDFDRGYFDMTDEDAEELAWELFKKIPFMDGEYGCIGIRESIRVRDNEGSHITRAGVVFCRLLDGVRVTGDETCTLYLDGSGLVEIRIRLYCYEKTGTMEMVSLADAETKLKTPDDFDILTVENKKIETLQIDQVYLRLVNQYSRGCTILQPIYFFKGMAAHEDNTQSEFSSKVIAIPEELTYE